MKPESGYLVETKSGNTGRTYNDKEMINGKVPVYLYDENGKPAEKAILCDPKTLKTIGFID